LLISIIIPASNSEKTIDRCVESAIKQKFKKFEVLIIENNSKDSTWERLLSLKKKYNKIKIFRNKNSGVSKARNHGILKSKGKYLLFLDSDDELIKNSLVNLYKFANKKKIDFAIAAYTNKISKKDDYVNETKLFTKEGISKYFKLYCQDQNKFTVFTHVWGRLYLRKILLKNNIKFNNKFNQLEDVLFNINFLNSAKKVGYLNKIVYRQNLRGIENRSSFKFNHKIIYLITLIAKNLEKFLIKIDNKKDKNRIKLIVENFVVSKILTYIIRICFSIKFIIKRRKILKKIYYLFKSHFKNYDYNPNKNQDSIIYKCLKNQNFSTFYLSCFVKYLLLNINKR